MTLTSSQPNIDLNGRYSVTEASKILNIHRSTIWRWVRQGKLRPYVSTINSRTRFIGKDLMRLWQEEI